jgi:MOSC domain-containing protein YiiM
MRDEMSEGRVVGICIGPEPGQAMQAVTEVVAVADRGLEGDRYFQAAERANPALEITLIESEGIELAAAEWGMEITLEDTRRNIVTAGISLDGLLGKRFRVGEAEVEALEANPPCRRLAELAGKPLLEPLARRGGVRGRIVRGGVIRTGDPIRRDD